MTDMPVNTELPSGDVATKSAKQTSRDVAIETAQQTSFFAVLFLILAIWIIQSPFLQNATGGWQILLLLGLIAVVFYKFVVGYMMSMVYNLVILLIFLLGAWLVNEPDHDMARIGAIVLLVCVIIDVAYLYYMYYTRKFAPNKVGLWAGIIGGVISIIMLIVALFWA